MRYLALLSLLFASGLCSAQDHFRFVVTGDDRWDTGHPRDGESNGVNVAGFTRVVAAILAEKPAIVLFNGDTIGGGDDTEEASQYKTYLSVVQPLYDARVRVLNIRGNHEMHAEHSSDLWRSTFSGVYANPGDGPKGEEDLTFSLSYGNSLFLGLDEFATKDPVINQAWLDATLSKSHATHVFAFAHKMAFKSGHHVDGMNTVPDARDRFLDSFSNGGGVALFFGHDHLYDHLTAAKTGWPDGKEIHQIVVGTGGAPFVNGVNSDPTDGQWSLKHLGHVEGRLGYCVVDVDGAKVTVTYKAETEPGKFEVADTFSFTAAPRK